MLDALTEAGFVRMGEEVSAAIEGAGDDVAARVQAGASAYVRFATSDAALLEVMFANKNTHRTDAVRQASSRLFGAAGDLIKAAGRLASGRRSRTAASAPSGPSLI